MKFDYIIQNPPYKGSKNLFLQFFNKSLDLLSSSGQMSIIGPCRWTIDIRKSGKFQLYENLRLKLGNKVTKIIIENLNKEFNISNYIPLGLTFIDNQKTISDIEFVCFGSRSIENDLKNCNLIGPYDLIWSIFDKIKTDDMMRNHFLPSTQDVHLKNMYYTRCANIVGAMACSFSSPENGLSYNSDALYYKNYLKGYYNTAYSLIFNDIYSYRPYSIKRGSTNGSLSDKLSDCVFGTKRELSNWKNFVLNNKLPLFVNIVLTIDQHNYSYDFLPWIADKKYTDEELYNKFNFTEEEIKLIEDTLIKYNKNSIWFKRYIGGRDAK